MQLDSFRWKKKFVSILIAVSVLVTGFYGLPQVSVSAAADFAGGSGTKGNPWIIETPAQLANMGKYLSETGKDRYYKLGKDISLSNYLSNGQPGYDEGKGWIPIGNANNSFQGKLDGNGKKIIGLWTSRMTPSPETGLSEAGLFGYTQNAEIRNLYIEIDTAKKMSGSEYVGALASWLGENSVVTGCSIKGSIQLTGAYGFAGGLSGGADNKVSVSNCSFSGSIQVKGNKNNLGGLFGEFDSGSTAQRSFANATINAVGNDNYAGGLVGWVDTSSFSDCYAAGTMTASGDKGGIGGFSGYAYAPYGRNTKTSNCFSAMKMSVSGKNQYIGGFWGVENFFAENQNCFFDQTLAGRQNASGYSDKKGISGKTTAQMMRKSTFIGGADSWNFTSVWDIHEGKNYPQLRWSVVTGIALNTKNIYLIKGATTTITATVSPNTALNKTVTWSSSNSTIASVDKSSGTVTAKWPGIVNIYATSGAKTVSAQVTVSSYVSMRIGKTAAVQNGQKTTIDKSGTVPIKIGGKTMLPMRFVGEKMGGKVKYVNDKTPITLTYGNTTVEITLGRKVMTVKTPGKKNQSITLDVPAQKRKGKTLIPLRAISQALGFDVYYQAGTEYIVVNNPKMTSALRSSRLTEAKKLIG